MVKKVAGGRFDARSEPGMPSPLGPVATVSPAYAPGAPAQTPIENAIAAANTDKPNFGVFPRGVIKTSPMSGTSANVF
jgi:hypothetical protein